MRLQILIICVFVVNSSIAQALAPSLSLHNKSKKDIYVYVKNRDILGKDVGTAGGPFLVRPGQFLDKEPDVRFETKLIIESPLGVKRYEATFTLHKTIYVNWNDKAKKTPPLYPQRGPKKGKTGSTDLGYRLFDNVALEDIKATELRDNVEGSR